MEKTGERPVCPRISSSVPAFLCPRISCPYNKAVLTDEDKQCIREQLARVETTLLTEFHKWALPVEMRQKSHAAALRALDAEVESISDLAQEFGRPLKSRDHLGPNGPPAGGLRAALICLQSRGD